MSSSDMTEAGLVMAITARVTTNITAMLGAVLRKPQLGEEMAAAVNAYDVTDDVCHRLVSVVVALAADRRPIDIASVYAELVRRGQQAVVTAAYLSELYEDHPTAVNFEYHLAEFRDAVAARKLLHLRDSLFHVAASQGHAEDLVADAEREFAAVRSAMDSSRGLATISDSLNDVFDLIDKRNIEKGVGAVLTGLYDLDTILGGFRPGEMIVLGARPGLGKSALAAQIAQHVAGMGMPVLFATMEMVHSEVTQRMLVRSAGVNNFHVRSGNINAIDADLLAAAAARLRPLPLYYVDNPRLSLVQLVAHATRCKRQHGMALLVVDYLQLVRPANQRTLRHEQVAETSRGLKALAGDLGVPVLALCQLNRAAEGENRPPRLSDLRESASIEADADAVILMHREAEGQVPQMIQLNVAKQRNGERGPVVVEYYGHQFRFRTATR